jgi:hypothetical protein
LASIALLISYNDALNTVNHPFLTVQKMKIYLTSQRFLRLASVVGALIQIYPMPNILVPEVLVPDVLP